MRLVGNLATGSPDNVSPFLLLYFVQLLLARLVHNHDIFLQQAKLLLEGVKLICEVFLANLVLVELLIEQDDLILINTLLALVKALFQHDSVPLVLQLAILLVVND